MYKVLGVSELDILVPDSRLAELKMQEAHDQDHKGAKITLWRSRTEVWIWKGMRLAERVVKACDRCIAQKITLMEQQMGDFDERMEAFLSQLENSVVIMPVSWEVLCYVLDCSRVRCVNSRVT